MLDVDAWLPVEDSGPDVDSVVLTPTLWHLRHTQNSQLSGMHWGMHCWKSSQQL